MNDDYQLGFESEDVTGIDKMAAGLISDVTKPTRIETFDGMKIKLISGGESHGLAVTGDDNNEILWAWGRSMEGQLGIGQIEEKKMPPKQVQLLLGSQISKVF